MKNFYKRAFLHFLLWCHLLTTPQNTEKWRHTLSPCFFASTRLRQHSHPMRTTSRCLSSQTETYLGLSEQALPLLRLEPPSLTQSSVGRCACKPPIMKWASALKESSKKFTEAKHSLSQQCQLVHRYRWVAGTLI